MPAKAVAIADRFVELSGEASAGDVTEQAIGALKADVGTGFDGDCFQALLASLGRKSKAAQQRSAWPAALTDREVEVLRLVARGLTISEVAGRLVVSAHTARHHLESVYSKVGVSSRAGAVLFAVENKLLR